MAAIALVRVIAVSVAMSVAVAVLLSLAGPRAGPIAQAQTSSPAGTAPVWLAQVRGTIDPPLASGVTRLITQAEKANAQAIVFTLDTPGGLDDSMRQIVQAEVASRIPVVFFVYPQGSRAASAGVYILMGADVAAMAPQTNLGAATPVLLTGQMDETMRRKVTNDAAAYIKALAEQHGRNTAWVDRAVRESVSLPASEAKAIGVVDFVSPDPTSLLRQMEGYTTKNKGITLHTAGAPIKEVGLSLVERLLQVLANPNVAYILLLLGVFGLIFELANPGAVLPGVAGGVALLLGLYAFEVLSVSFVGAALMVLALVLLLLEVKVQSHGALALAGTACLLLGGLLLFNGPIPSLRVNWVVVAMGSLVTLAFFVLVVQRVAQARRPRPVTGEEGLIGAQGVARTGLHPRGQVHVHGELWQAVTQDEAVETGETVEVVAVEGLTLLVRHKTVGER